MGHPLSRRRKIGYLYRLSRQNSEHIEEICKTLVKPERLYHRPRKNRAYVITDMNKFVV
jgi:hypothetical protein